MKLEVDALWGCIVVRMGLEMQLSVNGGRNEILRNSNINFFKRYVDYALFKLFLVVPFNFMQLIHYIHKYCE